MKLIIPEPPYGGTKWENTELHVCSLFHHQSDKHLVRIISYHERWRAEDDEERNTTVPALQLHIKWQFCVITCATVKGPAGWSGNTEVWVWRTSSKSRAGRCRKVNKIFLRKEYFKRIYLYILFHIYATDITASLPFVRHCSEHQGYNSEWKSCPHGAYILVCSDNE